MKRYVRNIALDFIDIDGQKKLNETTALVVGVGGLGSHLLYHLASYGLKKVIFIDFDTISISNLQRQILFKECSVGKSKVNEALKTLELYNSETEWVAIRDKFTSLEAFKDVDIIFDCCDNYQTRYILSKEAQKYNKNVVFASVGEFQGWVYPQTQNSVIHYENIFEEHPNDLNCDSLGVLSSSVSFVSSIQAMEGLKIILEKEIENYYLDINCFTYQVNKMVF